MENITESESPSSLKYERTQNRDIMKTIERINRSVGYASDAEILLNGTAKKLMTLLKRDFRQQWRNIHDSHENPPQFSMELSVGSPIYRKHQPLNGGDEYGEMRMEVSATFTVSSAISNQTELAEENSVMGAWFAEKVAPKLNVTMASYIKSMTDDSPFSERFYYPMLERKDEVDGERIIGDDMPPPNRINVFVNTAMRMKNMNGNSISDYCPAIESDFVHEGLVSNMAIAFARLDETN